MRAALFTYPDIAPVFFGRPAESVEVAALVWGTLIGITVVLALLNTYAHGGAEHRQRIRWVIVGFAFAVAAAAAGILGYSSLVPVQSSAECSHRRASRWWPRSACRCCWASPSTACKNEWTRLSTASSSGRAGKLIAA